ncbi:hypothetical protein NP233_g5714 [Leucocoprinus birnbaumii]|uniref:P-loop containing nucleoside triphosphate hydrolase protein n=1 Tax=Leucocoprinus birnbaumii TaxID=56174 RepID=A0AAD5VYG3_9AGAR|nr:hypothetical protein NP233_g5714 [Leucocoprinus birnbaumii]
MTGKSQQKVKVVFVGIGGATCSGKTTLAKHLRRILPDSVIIHQDDFAPPQELVPVHPEYNVQDWDAPAGAISWDRLIGFLRRVKETGEIPPGHRSHDHLNEQKDVPIPEDLRDRWVAEFQRIKEEREAGEEGTKIVWALIAEIGQFDRHQDVIAELDVRIMLRVPHDILKKRRHERHGYHTAGEMIHADLTCLTRVDFYLHISFFYRFSVPQWICPVPVYLWLGLRITAHNSPLHPLLTKRRINGHSFSVPFMPGVQSDPEGTLWRDPPHYWEQIVWPAYLEAHRDAFVNGDVECGAPNDKVEGLVLLETLSMTMGEAVDRSCRVLSEVA